MSPTIPTPTPSASAEIDVRRSQLGARGGRRLVLSRADFDLNVLGHRLIVELPRCVGAYVSVTQGAGSFSAATVDVKLVASGTLLPFGTAKSIGAGGGVVVLSEEDCLGLTQIALVVSGAEGAFGLGVVTVTIEEAPQN